MSKLWTYRVNTTPFLITTVHGRGPTDLTRRIGEGRCRLRTPERTLIHGAKESGPLLGVEYRVSHDTCHRR